MSLNLEDISISEIMQKDVSVLYEDQNVFEDSVLMSSKSIGTLPVIDKSGNLVGMLTDRDIVVRCCAFGKDIRKTNVREIMTPNPVKTVPSHACKDATYLMGELGLRRLPIVEHEKLVGIISISDFAKAVDCQTNDGFVQQPTSVIHGLLRKLQTTSHYKPVCC